MPSRPRIDSPEFVQLVASADPRLADQLEENDGLENVQVRDFADHTQAAIERGDLGVVKSCFAIADRVLADGEEWMQSAIHVSFLEHLDFRGPHGKEAFAQLTPLLRKAWTDINEYMENLLDGDWTWKRPPD